MNPDTAHNSGGLPPRELPKRRSGRHRNPLSFESLGGTPTLVLASAAGAGGGDVGDRMAGLVAAYRPEVEIRVAQAGTESLPQVLQQTSIAAGGLSAIVVPLTAGPHPATEEALHAAVRSGDGRVRVTEPLGPHPMLAEVVHLRLAEAGFVRADRMRLISVVGTGGGMADGVVVGSVGGPPALEAAGVTAVLLAARLGVTVLPAPLDDQGQLEQALARLRDSGAKNPVLAPCLVGQEIDDAALERVASMTGMRRAACLGAHSTLAKIAALRFAEVLNSIQGEGPQRIEDLPAPTGSRHRPES